MEHLFPDWIVERFIARVRGKKGHFNVVIDGYNGQTRRWAQRTITQKQGLMCERCNGITIGSVEPEVRDVLIPLMEDSTTIRPIPQEDQLRLATWTVVRSMIWDGTAKPESRYYTQDERVRLATQDPLWLPANTSIWFGLYGGHPDRAVFTVGNSSASQVHVVTALLNRLVIQLATWRNQTVSLTPAFHDMWSTPLRQIWPMQSVAIEWPPAHYLDREEIVQLRRWFGFTNFTDE